MLSQMKQFFAPPVFENEDETRTASLLNITLLALFLTTLATASGLLLGGTFTNTSPNMFGVAASFVVAAVSLGFWFIMRQGYIQLVSVLVSALLFIAVVGTIYVGNGIRDNAASTLLLAVIMVSLLLGGRTEISVFTGASILGILGVFYAERQGMVTFKQRPVNGVDAAILVMSVGLTGLLLRYAIYNLNNALARARASEREAREAGQQLQALNEQLEQRVRERTRALETSTEVSRRLSTILDEQHLISEVVTEIRTAFNYYHAQIYLFDDARENLIMVGGTGDAGRQLLANHHYIPKGKGLVGKAANSGEPVLVPDVNEDKEWLPNKLLPETRAEVAVPIILSGKVIGVLDVQHSVTAGLAQSDADLLQSVANQVAIGLQNARLYAATQQRAERQALINTIGQKIQGTNDISDAMQVAVRELGRALDSHQTSVRLKEMDESGNGHEKIES